MSPTGSRGGADLDEREAEIERLWLACSNAGRWGVDDELGTLNYITPEKVVEAARLVSTGRTVSLAKPINTTQDEVNPHPSQRHMTFWGPDPFACGDTLDIGLIHGLALTHVDAVGHIFWRGKAYNGRDRDSIVHPDGLTFGSVLVQGSGVLTRGVLLDVARARGVEYFSHDEMIGVADLEHAEAMAGTRVRSGDALIVHLGLERLEAVHGPSGARPGLAVECIGWMHERQVAVYAGDCQDKLPPPDAPTPLPFHQIGLPAMGLVIVDNPSLEDLVQMCAEIGRYEFAFSVAALRVANGTGSPVNPICIF